MLEKFLDYKLCYINNLEDYDIFRVYFTSKFEGQWGDDWNDRPACSNAGEPYSDDRDIYSIIISNSGFNTTTFGGRTYSVEDMNTKKACWLIYDNIFLEGGDTLQQVLNKIKEHNLNCESYNKTQIFIEYGDEN